VSEGLQEGWDLPSPVVVRVDVQDGDIDAYGHVNNAVYVTWLDRAAWHHSALLGLPIESCVALDRGMAVVRTEIDYLRAAVRGDAVDVATWIVGGDGRLRAIRRFQARRASDGATLARARVEYACIQLSTGRPSRFPPEFRGRYEPVAAVAAALVHAAGANTP
jgi:acyl-CoA thioester hydrolase